MSEACAGVGRGQVMNFVKHLVGVCRGMPRSQSISIGLCHTKDTLCTFPSHKAIPLCILPLLSTAHFEYLSYSS